MKTLQDNIDIMQALSNGVIIEVKFRTGMEWEEIHNSRWKEFNFANFDYRIKPEPKPEPTLLERIEAKWPDKKVVMLYWDTDDTLCIKMGSNQGYHTCAQSMKGFFKYVYTTTGKTLILGHTPSAEFASYETVGALFSK